MNSQNQNMGQFPQLSSNGEEQHQWLNFVASLRMELDSKITRNCFGKIFRLSRQFKKATQFMEILSIIQKKFKQTRSRLGQDRILSSSDKFFVIYIIKSLQADQIHIEYAAFLEKKAKTLQLSTNPNDVFLAKKINKLVVLIRSKDFNDQQGINQVFSSLNQLEQDKPKNKKDIIMLQYYEGQIMNICSNLTEKEKAGITIRNKREENAEQN